MELIILFTILIIVIDIVTGILKGIKQKEFDSAKLRKGGLNKTGELIVIILSYLLDVALPKFKISLDFKVCFVSCSYLFFMELCSIIENLGAINPDLIPPQLSDIFKKL